MKTNYELKNTILLEAEIEVLRDKIKSLKRELADIKNIANAQIAAGVEFRESLQELFDTIKTKTHEK